MLKTLLNGAALGLLISAAPIVLPGLLPLGQTAAMAQEAKVSFSIFFNDLSQYGLWVKHPKYQYVWCPRDVDAGWVPYTHGHWVYTDRYGWYFASQDPYAWAVYHYGRWVDDNRLGWCWIPGSHWAPAWVSWRRSNDYVGWAPLPPEEEGFSVNLKISSQEPPKHDWIFVPTKDFVEPNLTVNVVIGDSKPDLFQHTQYAGPVVIQNNVVINNVIDVNFIQQQTNKQVTKVKVNEVNDPNAAQQQQQQGDTINVFAANIPPPTQQEAPKDATDPAQAAQQLGPRGQQNAGQTGTDQQGSTQQGTDQTQQPANGTDQNATGTDQNANGAQTGAGTSTNGDTNANAGGTSAGNGDANKPTDQNVKTCPEGQELVDGKCVPATKGSDKGKGQGSTDQQQSGGSNANGATSSDSSASGSSSSSTGGSGATSTDNANGQAAAPADQGGSTATDKSSSSSGDKAKPEKCPDGQVLVDGKCVPATTANGNNGNASDNANGAAATDNGKAATDNGKANGSDNGKANDNAAPADNGNGNGSDQSQGGAAAGAANDNSAAPADKGSDNGKGQKCPDGYEFVKGKCVLIQQTQ